MAMWIGHPALCTQLRVLFCRPQEHADAAGAVSLLLLLKSWLKNTFNLSDAKCLVR